MLQIGEHCNIQEKEVNNETVNRCAQSFETFTWKIKKLLLKQWYNRVFFYIQDYTFDE